MKDWVKPGIYNGLQKISIPLFGVLSTALLAHKALTKPEMGVWVNFLALTTFVEMFRSGIVRTSLIKYINYAKKDQHAEIMSSAFLLNVIVSFIAGIILLLTSGYLEDFLKSPGLAYILNFYIITLFILVFFSHLEWMMYAHLDFKSLFYTYILRQGSTFFGILIYYLVVGKATLEALVIIYTAGVLLGTLLGFLFIKYLFRLKFIFSKHWIMELWNFGKFVFGSNISTLIFRNADQFLLSNLTANPAMVASQNISMRIINIADIPSQVIGDVLFPKNSSPELIKMRHLTKYYYEKAVGASLSIIFPFLLGLLIFPKLLILILAGQDYLDAVPYLRLIAFSIFFQAYLKQFGVIMDSSGFPNVNFRTITFIAIAMVGFCYLFIPKFHLMGAAYALLAAQATGFLVSQFLLKRYFKISFFNTFKYCISFYPEMFKIFTRRFFRKTSSPHE